MRGWALRAIEDATNNLTLPPLDSDGTYFEQVYDKFAGMGDSVKNTVEGLASPVQAAKGLAEAASHPGTTFRRIAEDVRDKSTQSRGQGEVAGELIQAGAGPPVAGKVLGTAANWYRRLKQSIKGRIKAGGKRTPTPVKTPLPAQPAEPPKPARPVKKPEPIRFQHPDLEDARKALDDPLLERTIEFHQNPPRANAPKGFPVPDASYLSKLGEAPGKGQLSKAGHSLSKHAAGKRGGSSAFPDPKGSPSQINQQAQKLLDDILNDPAKVVKQRPGRPGETLLQINRADGSGVIYKWDGTGWQFSHFAENLF